jgi:hypothetical protein
MIIAMSQSTKDNSENHDQITTTDENREEQLTFDNLGRNNSLRMSLDEDKKRESKNYKLQKKDSKSSKVGKNLAQYAI